MMTALVRTESAAPVRESWSRLGKSLEEEDRLEEPDFGVELVEPEEANDWRIAVVEMPAPEGPGEAQFVALAVRTTGGDLAPESDDGPRETTDTQYAVLEGAGDETVRLLVERDDALEAADVETEPTLDAFVESFGRYLSENSTEEDAHE